MKSYIEYFVEYLGLPGTVMFGILIVFFFMQAIGELLEFKGKIVPEIMKVRKYIARKRSEKKEQAETLKEVRRLLNDVNSHYSADNIAKRDSWMQWVNNRANTYDDSIVKIGNNLADVTQALRENTRMTEEMFIESSRDRIIDFATKAGSDNSIVSKEEFNRIFKVYDKYEKFLADRHMTNGEVDIAYRIIKSSYENHLKNHTFIEDIRGYDIQ